MNDTYFLPPWNMNEHPEKTEGWIAFQKAMKDDPEYYLPDEIKLKNRIDKTDD
jgi:hypothetical protein